MRKPLLALTAVALLHAAADAQAEKNVTVPVESPKAAEPRVRFDPVVQKIEGWTVHVEPALLEGNESAAGRRALRMLADHLHRVTLLVQGKPLAKLKSCEIWIERHHPVLDRMQYHPSAAWLRDHKHDPRLAKKVHIPRAGALLSRSQLLQHPAVVLHELSHAYHDQVLGFDYQGIVDCYEQAMEEGKYDQVLSYTGRTVKHYAATNHKEYFAEGTEAYFYRNDFFPFVRAELNRHDPRLHAELKKIWGPAE